MERSPMPVIQKAHQRPGVTYALLAMVVLAVALAGFLGFIWFPTLGIPSAAGAALLGFAAAAGIASFFSPCSFPLLVMLLTRQTAQGSTKTRAVRFAAALSAGAAAFLILLGAAVGAGGAVLFKQITFSSASGRILRLGVGVLLVTLASMQAGWIPWPLGGVATATKRKLRITSRLKEHPISKFALFGFAYLLAGFG